MVTRLATLLVFLATVAQGQVVSRVVKDGCVGAWSFEDNMARDLIGTNNGTLIGSPQFNSGIVGKNIGTRPTNNAVRVGFPWGVSKTGPKSISCSIFPTNNSIGYIVGNLTPTTTGLRYYFQATNIIVMAWDYRPTETTFTNDFPLNKWTHLVAVFSNTTALLYKNGVLLEGKSITAESMPAGNAIRIGARPDANGSTNAAVAFSGFIDEVAFYNRAVQESDVRAIFFSRRPTQ